MYACTEGQALHKHTCLHPLVLHINDSQENHANWYISHCVTMLFQQIAYTNSSTKLPTLSGRWLVSFYLFILFIFMGSTPTPIIFPLCSLLAEFSWTGLYSELWSCNGEWIENLRKGRQGKMWKSGSQTLNQVGFTWFTWKKYLSNKCYLPKDYFCHISKWWWSFIKWMWCYRHRAKSCVCTGSVNPCSRAGLIPFSQLQTLRFGGTNSSVVKWLLDDECVWDMNMTV